MEPLERQSNNKGLKEIIENSNIEEDDYSEDGTTWYRVAAISPIGGTIVGAVCGGWSGAGYGFLIGVGAAVFAGCMGYFCDVLEDDGCETM